MANNDSDRMMGKKHKPFCGDCCDPYKQGSGEENKRVPKKQTRQSEKRTWKRELEADMAADREEQEAIEAERRELEDAMMADMAEWGRFDHDVFGDFLTINGETFADEPYPDEDHFDDYYYDDYGYDPEYEYDHTLYDRSMS